MDPAVPAGTGGADDEAAPTSSIVPAGPRVRVTAVLVCHDGEAFLPRTLAALDRQTRRPDQLIAADTGSCDGGPELLAGTAAAVLRLPRTTSFGDAVQAALAGVDAGTLTQSHDPRPAGPAGPVAQATTGGDVTEWLWLLHDDSAPAPDVLERLLQAVDSGPSIAIAGCKQVSWDDERRLLDVGFTTSRLGARVTGVDIDDMDQGQLDARSDVLAVGTAGMLVRRDVWDDLGGPDPALVHARDDVDLCRRAHLAGHRVVVVPRAMIAHATASATARRPGTGQASWWRQDRRDTIYLRLAGTPALLLPVVLVCTVFATLGRAATRLVLKQPARAADELSALALTVARPGSWWRARRRSAGARTVPRRSFNRLLAAPRDASRQRRDTLGAYMREQEELAAPRTAAHRPAPPDPAEAPPADAAEGAARTRSGPTPAAVVAGLTLVTGIVALLGLRGVVGGPGASAGPALLPAPADASALWQTAMSGWHAAGLGSPDVADPLLAVLAGIGVVLGGSARAAVDAVLLAALPLAALAGWFAAGAITSSRSLRAWAAIVWAGAPPLLLAVATGRLGGVVAHIALPLAALALVRAMSAGGARAPGATPAPAGRRARVALSAASTAGLLLTLVLAGAPALAVPVAVLVVAVAVIAGSRRGLLLWTALVPAVLLLPWWAAVVRQPSLLLAEPGGPVAPAGVLDGAGWVWALLPRDPASLAGDGPGSAGAALAALPGFGTADLSAVIRVLAVVLAVPVLVLAAAALVRRGRRLRAVGLLWLAGLGGAATAVLVPRLSVASGPEGPVHGWPGPGLSLAALGLLGAALCCADGAAGRLRLRPPGWRHALAVGLAIVAVLGPVAALGSWAVRGWTADDRSGWVRATDPDVVPAVAAAEAEGPAAARTLVLRVTEDGARWSLARAGGPRLGDLSAASATTQTGDGADDPAAGAALSTIGGLLSDTGRDERDGLAALGVGSVLLLPPLDDAAVVALDTAPGLVRVASPRGAVLWRVEVAGARGASTRPARARVLDADGRLLQTLPSRGTDVATSVEPGPAGRTVALAERAAPGWQARLDGDPLQRRTVDGWAQAWELPAPGGTLAVTYSAPGERWTETARLGVLVLALLLAVPLPRRRRRLLPTAAPRRVAYGYDDVDLGDGEMAPEFPELSGADDADRSMSGAGR